MNMEPILESHVKQRRATLSYTTLESFQFWANDLLRIPLGQACLQLWQGLAELRELDCDDELRFQLLQYIEPTMTCLCHDLYNISLQNHDVQSRAEQLLQLLFSLQSMMIVNYYDIAQRLDEQIQARKGKVWQILQQFKTKTTLLKVCYYGLKAVSKLNYYLVTFGKADLKQLWYLTHQFYILSYKNDQHKVYLKSFVDQQPHDYVANNMIQQYKQILLFNLLASPHLGHNDLENILGYSYEWAKYLKFKTRGNRQLYYQISFNSDLPMQFYLQQRYPLQQVDLLVDSQLLIQYFNQSHIVDEFTYNPALRLHIHYVLTQGYKRQDERYNYSAQLEAYLGYQDMVNILSQNINQNINQDKSQSERYKINHYILQVLDKSRSGYKLQWKGKMPFFAKKGNLLLIREKHEDGRMPVWQSVIIRWTKQIEPQLMDLGVEILASQQITVELSRNTQLCERAILAYIRRPRLGESYFLILSKDTNLVVGEHLNMKVEQHQMQIQLGRFSNQESHYLLKCDIKLKKVQDSDILYSILTEPT